MILQIIPWGSNPGRLTQAGRAIYSLGAEPLKAMGGALFPGAFGTTPAGERLEAERGNIPEKPEQSAEMAAYRRQLFEKMQEGPQDYKQSAYYGSIMSDIDQQMKRRGWKTAGAHGAQATPGGYGQGRREANVATEMEGRLQLAAAASAEQQQRAARQQEVDSLLRSAGFEQGVQSAEWETEFKIFLANKGLTEAQIEAEMERARMWFGLVGQGLRASQGGGGGGGAAV